jgi:hypothetical protein
MPANSPPASPGQEILVKALNDVCLGAGYMRVTTARRKSSLRP